MDVRPRLPLKCEMNFCATVLTLVFVFGTIPTLWADAPVIRVFATEFPPFSGPSLPEKGLAIQELTAFADERGFTVDVIFMPVARAISLVRAEGWQGSIIRVPDGQPNVGEITYSENVVQYGLISSKDSRTRSATSERIGVIRAGEPSAVQKALVESGAQLVEVTSLPQAFRMLDAGRLDRVLGVFYNGKPVGLDGEPAEPLQMDQVLAEIPFVLFLNLTDPEAKEAYDLSTVTR